MQLAAETALDVGEHGHGVLRVLGREHDAVLDRDRLEQLAAQPGQAGLAQVALGIHVVQAALQHVAAVVADVERLPADDDLAEPGERRGARSEEHTSELQSLMRISYAVFCLKKKTQKYAYSTGRMRI